MGYGIKGKTVLHPSVHWRRLLFYINTLAIHCLAKSTMTDMCKQPKKNKYEELRYKFSCNKNEK